MKILELTNYSAGICGVWTRAREEAIRLAEKGHEVAVFSSNFVKGSDETAEERERIGNVIIKRFPARKLGGESFIRWDFEDEALNFKPDVIIAHSYRHIHTTKALKVAEKLRKDGINCKVFLVTHAPFERGSTRGLFANIAVYFYDNFIGRNTIKKFDKVIAITKWEMPYLKRLGLNEDKIEYIPNGIPEEFFRLKELTDEKNKILFIGRISPLKSVETVISAMPLLKNKKITFEIVGPAEENYLEELKELISNLGISNRVLFPGAIFDLKEKIKKIDSAKIFVLPSKSEGMPQSLVEAMARGKVVVASDTPAARDLIEDGKNGFLFRIGDEKELAGVINKFDRKMQKSRKEAKKSVEKFAWGKIIERIEKLLI
jgi:glycosyltransferase involved in cell wall biosynthesis